MGITTCIHKTGFKVDRTCAFKSMYAHCLIADKTFSLVYDVDPTYQISADKIIVPDGFIHLFPARRRSTPGPGHVCLHPHTSAGVNNAGQQLASFSLKNTIYAYIISTFSKVWNNWVLLLPTLLVVS